MLLKSILKLNLKKLIVLLALSASLALLTVSFYSTYKVQKEQLINYTLKANFAYASKLASATDNFLYSAQQQLEYSAHTLEKNINNKALLKSEVERLNLQTDSFNSVIISIGGVVAASSPVFANMIGKKLESAASLAAYAAKKPLISNPFVSFANNLVIFISQPIFDEKGVYLGYIGGTLYLKETNILSKLLKQHYYEGGSFIYVVDEGRRILFHPDESLIGTRLARNPMLDAVTAGETGAQPITNNSNIEMLAGYAPIKRANWGVIAQRPVSATLSSVSDQVMAIIWHTLPSALIIFILVGIFAHYISRPLKQLADKVALLNDVDTAESVNKVSAWYFESKRLKGAMLKGANTVQLQMGQLRNEALLDPLTGAQNRRSLNLALENLVLNTTEFTILTIDIDHFKRINDNFGHDIGDKTLYQAVKVIEGMSRKDDIVARVGGEEFMLILPNQNRDSAIVIAERLRIRIANTSFETIGNITVSIGIAHWPFHGDDINSVFKCADKALYQAKSNGRNCCVLSPAVLNE
ncbi:GGDEF domain-containing protein [Pseudoalteromonas sp. MMG010]|uniref:sensor domain-containing diguanylate cyclase n=1 Tax=Pseudoalteromonas sp. MMG010 TaxID=2822685 RepID=UPI001B3A2EAB|nr:sensor domain-containing diguanylate cyclase [Pseudoalteromonas sp. MMG010]MBQ4833650.1 GGDEF domain-containing protein [Pseudoalteromonas sp. MMG010]